MEVVYFVFTRVPGESVEIRSCVKVEVAFLGFPS